MSLRPIDEHMQASGGMAFVSPAIGLLALVLILVRVRHRYVKRSPLDNLPGPTYDSLLFGKHLTYTLGGKRSLMITFQATFSHSGILSRQADGLRACVIRMALFTGSKVFSV